MVQQNCPLGADATLAGQCLAANLVVHGNCAFSQANLGLCLSLYTVIVCWPQTYLIVIIPSKRRNIVNRALTLSIDMERGDADCI